MVYSNSYHGACWTAHAPAGQSVSFHGTVLHHTLTVCAHIHHKLFPCLDKHTLHTMYHLNNPRQSKGWFFSALLTPITVLFMTQASSGAAGEKCMNNRSNIHLTVLNNTPDLIRIISGQLALECVYVPSTG